MLVENRFQDEKLAVASDLWKATLSSAILEIRWRHVYETDRFFYEDVR